ncbi:hypothetical protein BJY00DRAFT_310443 [Aspergillus carlsbadensis]|nr:hypothetical protein BJY00DRAFT_310443 [Aspergillus carlsbadensis]
MTETTPKTDSQAQGFALTPEGYLKPATGSVKETLTFKLYLCVEPITSEDITGSWLLTHADFIEKQHRAPEFKNEPPSLCRRTHGFWVDPAGLLRYVFGSVKKVCQDYSVAIVESDEKEKRPTWEMEDPAFLV